MILATRPIALYFTMEFVEGGSLAERIAKARPGIREAAELIATLAIAVQFAQKKTGVVHRDLKPGNILLTLDNVPKLTDFGLAGYIEGNHEFTFTGTRIGTPSYMAPEQVVGKTARSARPPNRSGGAVLYELLTGRPPFKGESPAETERLVIATETLSPLRESESAARFGNDLPEAPEKAPARRYASATWLTIYTGFSTIGRCWHDRWDMSSVR